MRICAMLWVGVVACVPGPRGPAGPKGPAGPTGPTPAVKALRCAAAAESQLWTYEYAKLEDTIVMVSCTASELLGTYGSTRFYIPGDEGYTDGYCFFVYDTDAPNSGATVTCRIKADGKGAQCVYDGDSDIVIDMVGESCNARG